MAEKLFGVSGHQLLCPRKGQDDRSGECHALSMPARTLQAVIFDLDGLLVDTEALHYRSWRDTLAEIGITLGLDEYRDLWIRAGGSIESYLRFRDARHDPEVLRARKLAHYSALLEVEMRPMPCALELIHALRPHVRLALATASFQVNVDAALRKIGAASVFDVIATRECVRRAKPHPDVFLHTARHLKVGTHNCVVLEDAEKGVRAARDAGMLVVAVPTMHTRTNDFSSATLVVNSLCDLTLERLERLVTDSR